jgi:hypothetical protein
MLTRHEDAAIMTIGETVFRTLKADEDRKRGAGPRAHMPGAPHGADQSFF